jgi:hypothetical protein
MFAAARQACWHGCFRSFRGWRLAKAAAGVDQEDAGNDVTVTAQRGTGA